MAAREDDCDGQAGTRTNVCVYTHECLEAWKRARMHARPHTTPGPEEQKKAHLFKSLLSFLHGHPPAN